MRTSIHFLVRLVFGISILFFFSGCDNGDPADDLDVELSNTLFQASGGVGHRFFRFPDAGNLTAVPADPNNPLTPEKVALGQLLYHETALAMAPKRPVGALTYSCASCHHAAAGFQSGLRQGISEGGMGFGFRGESRVANPEYAVDELDIQPIRTPSAMNIAYQEVILWNGQFGATGPNAGTQAQWTVGTPKETNTLGFQGTETQAIAGLTVHRMDVENSNLEDIPEYVAMFAAAFPGVPAVERISMTTAGLAIAAYERTLLANEAPFQRWLRGEYQAMSAAEKRGAILFFGKAECSACHSGPALNNMDFHALGMADLAGPDIKGTLDDATRRGRGGFTGVADDDFKFKTPQLYNLMDGRFFGHGASFRSVREIVEYKNRAVSENPAVPANRLDPMFQPLLLSDQEVNDLVAFLETALYDGNLTRYVPASIPSSGCFPNNDAQSRIDLGCE